MSDSDSHPPWGWADTLSEFLTQNPQDILDALKQHHKTRFPDFELGHGQLSPWIKTIDQFQTLLDPLADLDGGSDILVALEYELPGEGGRRPDVILVAPTGHIAVIECKNRATVTTPDIDQATHYVSDLERFHSESHDKSVSAYVALLESGGGEPPDATEIPVLTSTSDGFEPLYEELTTSLETQPHSYDPQTWLSGVYEPLPQLTDAVITTFDEQRLPRIKHVHQASNVPEAIETIRETTARAAEEGSHILLLLTGAPGSGKTMVGLQSTMLIREDGYESLYLSGNDPLIKVIQDALDRAGAGRAAAKSIIKSMYKFKTSATNNSASTPGNVFVFDEGQRAWTNEMNSDYDGSEIELLLDAATDTDWSVIIGLIGEGQAIYKGEDGTINTWLQEAAALTDETDWEVVVPDRPDLDFETPLETTRHPQLHLDTTLRATTTEILHDWVDAVVTGQPSRAAAIASEVREAGYQLYLTPDRDRAEAYVRQYFSDSTDHRYGWLVSSEHSAPKNDSGSVESQYVEPKDRRKVWGTWFNAPPEAAGSCCQLDFACDEFGCQGLELDFTLLCWGTDFKRRDGKWKGPSEERPWADDPVETTANVYRVLLTRGRQGLVIRCADDETRSYLKDCGLPTL